MRVIALAVLMATSLVLSSPVPATQRAMAQPATASDSVHQEDDSSSSADAAYFDLGDFHREVTAKNPAAQTWFDRGLAMCYAFNHEEAVRCFERALVEEPGMAMAFWGLAYAWGPNINNMEIESHQIAQASYAIRLASLHSKNATQLERDLIDASTKRFAVPVPDDREPLNLAYSQAMRDVYRKYPQDPMVASLFAESLMILRPWKHWTPDGKPAPETPEIVAVLEQSLEHSPNYPALCHLYIHAMEASPTPEKALVVADALREAMPGAGHLVHMPSHIDVLLGNYARVIEANRKAIEADAEFVRREGANNFYTLYRIHNYHFLVYGAMFAGQSELALQTARELVKQVPEAMLREQTDFLDAFIPTELHVLVRFGRWDEILSQAEPSAQLPVTRSVWHYARALAYAATERVELAEQEQRLFLQVREDVPETSILFNNASRDILGVAEAMIQGEIAYRKQDFDAAFEHLSEAVRRDDSLNYDEPWGWMQPARHALGALLLEQGFAERAEAVYRADLKRHPRNVWALHGLAECLDRQGKTTEAVIAREQYDQAAKLADVSVDRSCFCRLTTEQQ